MPRTAVFSVTHKQSKHLNQWSLLMFVKHVQHELSNVVYIKFSLLSGDNSLMHSFTVTEENITRSCHLVTAAYTAPYKFVFTLHYVSHTAKNYTVFPKECSTLLWW